jgi:hypothetical protein
MNKIHYKEYPKMYIGESETCRLAVRYAHSTKELRFKTSGVFQAYVVDENADIAEHYKLIHSGTHWVRIYDDTSLSFSAAADSILIYRAGDQGCVIQLINPTSVNGEELKLVDEEEIYYENM